jgi:bacterioferritin
MNKNNDKAIACLNEIFKSEMSGIMRYLHYSFMVMGHNRIPIQKWLRAQAQESTDHAIAVGEKITSLGGHPPIISQKVEESNQHNIDQILKESLSFEEEALAFYKDLAKIAAESEDIALEEFARAMVKDETDHVDEVKKMLRRE